jgi:branched-chain amino acid transport system permease protein
MKIKHYYLSKSPYLKTSYRADMAIEALDTPFRRVCLFFALLVGVIFPFIIPPFWIHLTNLVAIACIGALALNFVIGNCGQVSLGQAGFLCAGGFTTAIMTNEFGAPFWAVILSSALVGALLGLIGGLPSLRLKGMYLGLSTLAVHYVILFGAKEYQTTSGNNFGIVVARPYIGPFHLSDDRVWYFFLWSVVGLVMIFIVNLLRTRVGRACIAIHDRDVAARFMGINIGYYKVLAFVVSSAIVAVAGSLNAYYTNAVAAEQFTFLLTVQYIAMIIVGGLGSVLGSFLGGFLITLLPYGLTYLSHPFAFLAYLERYHFAIESGVFGLLIIFFLIFEPDGLVEIWRKIRDYFMLWPFRFKPLKITTRR